MRRKNVLEYIMLGLFIMCMALALSASLEYNTRATERQFLRQGAYMLSLTGMMLLCFLSVRVINRAAPKMPQLLRNILWIGACAAIFGAGLYLRLRVIHDIVLEPESDFETYYRMARHLLNGTMLTPEAEVDRRYIAQYPHTIGFPMLVLVPVFRIFGMSVNNALYANLVCSMISVLLVGHIANRTMGKAACVMGMALMSLWPSHILYGSMVATEPSFTMLTLVALDLMVFSMERTPRSLYAENPLRGLVMLPLIGISLGLAGTIRPMALLLLAAWAVVQLFIGGDPEGKIKTEGIRVMLSKGWLCIIVVAVFYLGTGNVINRAIKDTIMEQPASGLNASGYNMMVGLNTQHQGIWNQEDADFFADAYEQNGSATEAHEAAMQRAIERIRTAPEDVMELMVFKFRDLWQTDDFGIDWNLLWAGQQNLLTPELTGMLETVRTYSRPVYMAILLLSLLGAIEAWRRQRAPMPLQMVAILFFLATALSHMLLETQVRYHYNMIPILILLSVICVYQWREHAAEEPAVRIVYQTEHAMEQAHEDHTHFDMAAALATGHIKMTVSAGYEKEAEEAKRLMAAGAQPEAIQPKQHEQPTAPEPEEVALQQAEPETTQAETPSADPETAEAAATEAPQATSETAEAEATKAEPTADAKAPEASKKKHKGKHTKEK